MQNLVSDSIIKLISHTKLEKKKIADRVTISCLQT